MLYEVITDPRVPIMVHGDPMRLGQIFLNFATNAVKFTDQGIITFSSQLLSQDATSLRIRFEVVDTGIGIPEAQQARLFQSFEQADTSTTRKYGGTGLGLAISRRLVQIVITSYSIHYTKLYEG